MTIATRRISTDRRMTLEEFLTYDDGTERRYELVDGVLVEMGTESTINTEIVIFLIETFLGLVGRQRIGIKQKIQVTSAYASARDPDLIIHTENSALAMKGKQEACLKLNDLNPSIVVEVVSPGSESSENYQRDYVQKPMEYADRGIPEMWLIDPDRAVVRVLVLSDGGYRLRDFRGGDRIVSPTFPDLTLAAEQVLQAGQVS